MGAAKGPQTLTQPKNYAQPEVLCHTFEVFSNLHKLLPNHLVEELHSYRSEDDKKKCEDPELSGLERILARHNLPREINVTPKPSIMPSWKRKIVNNASGSWKKCHLWKRNTREPPMCTIVVRWLKKNMQPTEDLKSVTHTLSEFGPIRSITSCGRQSAVVVFKDVTSACKAVSAFRRWSPGTMFHCTWQQRFMSKD
uniref:Testis expressed 56 n=1 Tax=Jaculus jaculus TaxID=51337 RepID=A0A8C5K5C7_JACJA